MIHSGTGKAIPVHAWTSLQDSKSLRLPEFIDNRYMKVARLSALHTGRLYHTLNIPGTYFCHRLSQIQGRSAAGRNM